MNKETENKKRAYIELYNIIESKYTKHSYKAYSFLNSIEYCNNLIKKTLSKEEFKNLSELEYNDIEIYLKLEYFKIINQLRDIFENIEQTEDDEIEDEEMEEPIKIPFWKKALAFWLGWCGMGFLDK